MKLLVTGGAGFIGSALIRHILRDSDASVVNVDLLTYAATPEALEETAESGRYAFEQADIADADAIAAILAHHRPDGIIHLAAESHVDRSIDGPGAFIRTNVVGTFTLLDAARRYRDSLSGAAKDAFRFHHVSTDEVYGSLGADDPAFCETTPYDPRSPYSASKASSDHLVSAWHETYGLPVVLTNCSNNYGLWQFPEKLIPVMIIKALEGEPLPVYGDGSNVRDWLHVEDHARALWLVYREGENGGRYNIGGNAERRNIDVVKTLCAALDGMRPRADGRAYADQITFVTDRPGHDHRYAIDASHIRDRLGWTPSVGFDEGMAATVRWYLENETWWRGVLARRHDMRRLGTGTGKSTGTS